MRPPAWKDVRSFIKETEDFLGGQTGTRPRVAEALALEAESVVQAAWAALPELDAERLDGVATPEIWAWDAAFRKTLSEASITIF